MINLKIVKCIIEKIKISIINNRCNFKFQVQQLWNNNKKNKCRLVLNNIHKILFISPYWIFPAYMKKKNDALNYYANVNIPKTTYKKAYIKFQVL